MDTGKGASHTGVSWERLGDSSGWGGWGKITWGKMPDIGDRGMEAANHLAYATILHDLHIYPRT